MSSTNHVAPERDRELTTLLRSWGDHFIRSEERVPTPSDGTNRRRPINYNDPNYGRAQGDQWNERNYSTGKRAPRRPYCQSCDTIAVRALWAYECGRDKRHALTLRTPKRVRTVATAKRATGKRTVASGSRNEAAATQVWVPQETDLQRHAAILGNNNHNNH